MPGSDNDHHNSTVFYKGALQTIAVMEGMTHVHLVMVVAVVSVTNMVLQQAIAVQILFNVT